MTEETIVRRYAVTVWTSPRTDELNTAPFEETLHVSAYTAADALVQIELHNLRVTGADFKAAITNIEPYNPQLHGEWKKGRLGR